MDKLTALYQNPLLTREQHQLICDIAAALPEQGIYDYTLPQRPSTSAASGLASFGAFSVEFSQLQISEQPASQSPAADPDANGNNSTTTHSYSSTTPRR